MEYDTLRKLKIVCGMFLLSLIFIVALYFDKTGSNEIIFSAESGFYDEDFYLEMNCEGAKKIYYTLDSSDPDENSILYTDPILISNASKKENKYCLINDTTLYNNEYLGELGIVDPDGRTIPSGSIDKANIIRAIAIDDNGNRTDVITKVYFVGIGEKAEYDGLNIISITTDPINLFDTYEGIYVTGVDFDNWILNYDGTYFEYMFAQSNYWRKGYRVSADVKFWDDNNVLIDEGICDIAIQGNGSRAESTKNINIYNDDYFDSRILGDKNEYVYSLNLYGAGQNPKCKLNDYLVNSLISDLNISYRTYKPYALFLDGEYWGNYYLTSKYDETFFSTNYDVIDSNVIFLKSRFGAKYVECGEDSDIEKYNELYEYVISHDMNDEEYYSAVEEMIDIESCIDYYAVNIYIANYDWPLNNYGMWRTRELESGVYADGKWRWVLYDLTHAMDNYYYAQNKSYMEYQLVDPFFASLMENEVFCTKMENRLVYLAENNFSMDNINAFIDNYEATMDNAMLNEYKRFYGDNKDVQDFYDGCEIVRHFFELRSEFIINTYGNKND